MYIDILLYACTYVCTIDYGFSLLMVGIRGTLRKATKDILVILY